MTARTLRTTTTLLATAVALAGTAQVTSTPVAQAAANSSLGAKPTVKRFKQRMSRLRVSFGGTTLAPDKPITARRVHSGPTGNASLDAYCQQVADLINDALSESDHALIYGDEQEAQAWWDLAMYMLAGGHANGCNFQARLRNTHLGVIPTAVITTQR